MRSDRQEDGFCSARRSTSESGIAATVNLIVASDLFGQDHFNTVRIYPRAEQYQLCSDRRAKPSIVCTGLTRCRLPSIELATEHSLISFFRSGCSLPNARSTVGRSIVTMSEFAQRPKLASLCNRQRHPRLHHQRQHFGERRTHLPCAGTKVLRRDGH